MTDAAKAADREGRYSDVQVQRIASHGHVRSIKAREVLVEPGQHVVPFFVVRARQIEIVRPSGTSETLVVYGPRQFTYRNWIKSNMRTGEGFTTEFAENNLYEASALRCSEFCFCKRSYSCAALMYMYACIPLSANVNETLTRQ